MQSAARIQWRLATARVANDCISRFSRLMLVGVLATGFTSGGATYDGKKDLYGIIITYSDDQWWRSPRDFYNLLTASYGADANNLFVFLVDDGVPATSPEIVDDKATRLNISNAVSQIASRMDDDDLFVFVAETHGNGYLEYLTNHPRNIAYHGYMGVQPRTAAAGDELDFKEGDIELSLFCPVGGAVDGRDFHYGMGQWGVKWYPGEAIVRYKVLSHFKNLFVNGMGRLTDSDVYLERFTDFASGDLNQNGTIEPEFGEVFDYDGDGLPPWNRETGVFDEDDWGNIDLMEDNCNSWHSSLVGVNFQAFDAGLDDRADIDINPSGTLHVDGTDTNNDGCIDGFDLNGDGDKNDWITMDETMAIYMELLTDGEVKALLSPLQSKIKIFIINTCFGGGFVNDLSGANTIIITGSPEHAESTTGFVLSLLNDALGVRASEADKDGDGQVNFMEAFNYASLHPYIGCGAGMDDFRYDDNADFISHEDPLPAFGDGAFGRLVGLGAWPAPPKDGDQDSLPDFW